jgi:tetratricopeptide (TPR) repeat protein
MMHRKLYLFFAGALMSLVLVPAQVLAWEGGSTGWCTDANGNNFRCSDGPPGGGSGGGSSGGSGANLAPIQGAIQGAVNSMVNAWVTEQQRRANEAFNLNETANTYYADKDYVTAIQYYEKAVSLNPSDAVIRNNLKNARAARARQLYELAYQEQSEERQLKYYQEAIRLDPLPEYVQSLKVLQDSLAWKRKYKQEKDEFASARANAGNVLDGIASRLGERTNPVYTPGSSSELEFITEKEPVVSKGSKDSAPPVLGGKETPQDLKKGQPQKGLVTKDVPLPEVIPEWDPLSAKTPGQIVLRALEEGKIDANKKGPSNLDVSINYLENYLKTENPNNVKVREAVSYLEGMRERAKVYEPEKKPNPFEASQEDSQYLLEAIAGKKIPQWPGEKNPNPKPFGRNPLDWRKQRNETLLRALKENQGDWDRTASYLEKKIAADPSGVDGNSRNAMQYLDAYRNYEEFTVKQGKPQQVKK